MSQLIPCALCATPTPRPRLTRYARLELCPLCMGGDLRRAIAAFPGVVADDVTERVVHNRSSASGLHTTSTYYILNLTLVFREPHHMSGTLTQEVTGPTWHKVRSVLRLGDPEVGDPLFDDVVKIKAADDSMLVEFLRRSQGAQDACMEALQVVDKLTWSDDFDLGVTRQASSVEELDVPALTRALLVIARHMALDAER